jgi:tetratricopeptide (TPR) repeat protein
MVRSLLAMFLVMVMWIVVARADGTPSDATHPTEVAPVHASPRDRKTTFAMIRRQPSAVVDDLVAISYTSPEVLLGIDLQSIHYLLRRVRRVDESGDLELRIHEALARARWRSPYPSFDDDLRVDYARILLERGRMDAARDVLATVVDPEALVTVRIQRQFDVLRQDSAFEAHLDLEKSIEASIARARTLADSNPRSLAAVDNLALVLGMTGRWEESLSILDPAIRKFEVDPQAFDDGEASISSVLENRGSALYAIGRFDEGRASYGDAAAKLEAGRPNVSNMINYGAVLVSEGRGADALALLPQIGAASYYGKGWIEAIRSCASVQVGDDAGVRKAGRYLKSHKIHNESALLKSLMCTNDLDGAAELMIRRLADPSSRENALLTLQRFPRTKLDETPFMASMLERIEVLRGREDVVRAVEAVGRIETIPVYSFQSY